uniref:HAUS augmin-like complex subunit 3 N-terminal domain-containing protein n=1 Tax=Megaselia scalaris TaxID=36166 RepID=T1GU55_MEGSC
MPPKLNLFETLGFDDSCWMLYDENLQNFFNFLENNVTKENILTDEEIQISADWKSRNAPMLSEEECNEKLKEYSKKFEGVANENIDREIEAVELEILDLEQIKNSYDEVNQEMEQNLEFTKTKISALESKIIELETAEKQAHEKCCLWQGKSKMFKRRTRSCRIKLRICFLE